MSGLTSAMIVNAVVLAAVLEAELVDCGPGVDLSDAPGVDVEVVANELPGVLDERGFHVPGVRERQVRGDEAVQPAQVGDRDLAARLCVDVGDVEERQRAGDRFEAAELPVPRGQIRRLRRDGLPSRSARLTRQVLTSRPKADSRFTPAMSCV